MTREDAQRKVRALLNTAAAGSGATDQERATAKRLADKLTAEHRLAEPPSPRVGVSPYFTVDVNVNDSNFGPSEDALRASIDELFRVKTGRTREEVVEAKRRVFRDILNGNWPG